MTKNNVFLRISNDEIVISSKSSENNSKAEKEIKILMQMNYNELDFNIINDRDIIKAIE